jgi:hypothetical protein
MNERIFELAKQADLIQWDTLPSGARTPDHESVVKAKKFAELIIKEALGDLKERIALRYQGSEKDRDIAYGMEIVYFDIVDKFGVK